MHGATYASMVLPILAPYSGAFAKEQNARLLGNKQGSAANIKALAVTLSNFATAHRGCSYSSKYTAQLDHCSRLATPTCIYADDKHTKHMQSF